MYYRRKVLLSLIDAFGGQLQNTDLQKLLFLFSSSQEVKCYYFVPYKFGGFSFQSIADKSALIKYGYLAEGDKWNITSKAKGIESQLKPEDRKILGEIKKKYKAKLGKQLVREVYLLAPYYAINSEIAQELLTKSEYQIVKRTRPAIDSAAFFTIGYEGTSLEEYLNKLIRQGIKVLCDVRKNALSQKFGFSKNQLAGSCFKVGIKYVHIPDLGIPSESRQNLSEQKDYDLLFTYYEETILPKQIVHLSYLQELMNQHSRIAITCFEACETQCHRGRVAKAIKNLPGWQFPILHI
jgi:uncharacterized protein (DUF488 family)